MPACRAAAKRSLDAATTDMLRRFADGFAGWARARPGPWSLVHNDYRLDNLLFAPGDTRGPAVTTVDWQSVSTGPPLLDVAYLLGTGLDPATRRAHERAIVGAYHDRLRALGVDGYDADRCWDDYRHALFHGAFICILADAIAAPTERGLRMFAVMAERTTAAVRDLDGFDLLTAAG